jgi:PhnB protein
METRISPWLSVRGGTAAVAFYQAAFGATVLERVENQAGDVVVARLAVGAADFWIADDPGSSGGGGIRLILTVADPDAVFAQALAAGATQIAAIHEGHGWRVGRVADPSGHHWEIGKPI